MSRLKEMRDELFEIQLEYETNEKWNEQSIRVGQRIRALLDIYEQIIVDDRVFEEEYLKRYLR